MTIFLVRHTRTSCKPGICYGHSDVGLPASFCMDRGKVADELGDRSFDTIYSSPSSRCRLLAAFLAGGQNVIHDDRLMELNFGRWEMKSWDSIAASPEGNTWFADYLQVRCPGGESYMDLIQRVEHFMEDHIIGAKGDILIVSHAGTIRALLILLNNENPRDVFCRPVDTGCVLRLQNSFR